MDFAEIRSEAPVLVVDMGCVLEAEPHHSVIVHLVKAMGSAYGLLLGGVGVGPTMSYHPKGPNEEDVHV